MRKPAFVWTALGLLGALALLYRPSIGQSPAPPANEDVRALLLVFGTKDSAPAKWDGSVAASGGEIVAVRGHHFSPDCKVAGASWECSTHAWGPHSGGMHPDERPAPQPYKVSPTGIVIHYRGTPATEFRVKVPRGEFAFRPAEIPVDGAIFPLQSSVEIYHAPVVATISGPEHEDDYPSIAASGDSVWTAWQAYRDEAERVFLRRHRGAVWDERIEVTEQPGDLFGTAVAASGERATVVWSQRIEGGWNLMARTWENGKLGAIETVATGGNNLFHRAAVDRAGNVHIAWQAWRQGRSNIYLRSRIGGKWGSEIALSDPKKPARANDWNAALAVDGTGTVWVAWDGYAAGNYDVYLRPVRNGKPGDLMAVTTSRRFDAHPSVAIDGQNRVWVAWDEAPENWGKDAGFLLTGGTGLYYSRAIRVAVLENGKWMAPLRQPDDILPWGARRYFHSPRLTADARGRIWLFARPRTEANLPESVWAAGGKWEVVATTYSGDRWSRLTLVPDSVGRNEGELQAAPLADGSVALALVTDQRRWGGPNFGVMPQNNEIQFTRLSKPPGEPPALAPRPAEPPSGLPSEPREAEQIAGIRAHTIAAGGKTYRIYRGDMHRHTDISMDGAGDGSLWDSYRYAMDAAGMDYLLVTDHQSGQQEYTWWRIDKSADMFHVPGFFTALYGTERSLSYPNGHRNLAFAKRGVRILPITQEEQKTSTGKFLYPYLRKNAGIAFSHTSHTNMGTDWRDNDPELEPLVEIFQGARTSAEHEGAPLSPSERQTELHAGGYRPLGYVWNAWAKGYKLGVQASSDHVSTHTSYSCIVAENASREALLDAMRKRHSYAATRNILLDYRLTADGATYLQGDVGTASTMPEIAARIVAAGPLKEVVVVRDNQYVYKQAPDGTTYDLRFRENALAPGEHYYYVRVEQRDGNVAWSSPIWLRYSGK